MISFEDAFRIVVQSAKTTESEELPLTELLGRVIAEQIKSPIDLPIFTNSAVDGYAIKWDDGDGSRTVVGHVAAGQHPTTALSSGQAMRINTGALIPVGADTVVMQEDVRLEGDRITLAGSVKQGSCIRLKSEEVKRGDRILESNTLIGPPELGVLASVGIASLKVYKRPRVSVIGTGSELVPAGSELKAGQIYESNVTAISAALKMAGTSLQSAVSINDDRSAIEVAMESALACSDVVITCGGVSVGEHDLVKSCAQKLGVEEKVWQVAMRPGKPFYFGLGPSAQLVFGLPGNPVSALVTYYVFVMPVLRKMAGQNHNDPLLHAVLSEPIEKASGRTEFVRATALRLPQLTLKPLEGQGSHMLTALTGGYLIMGEPERASYEKGETVFAIKMNWSLY